MLINENYIDSLLKIVNNFYIPILFCLLIGNYNNIEFIIRFVYLLGSIQFIKTITNRNRPNNSDNLSFPSGHTACAFYIAFNINNIVIYIWALLASLSRVYLGYHYYSDIIGGFLLSYIIYFKII